MTIYIQSALGMLLMMTYSKLDSKDEDEEKQPRPTLKHSAHQIMYPTTHFGMLVMLGVPHRLTKPYLLDVKLLSGVLQLLLESTPVYYMTLLN